jgi:hypothetical protein
LGNPKSKVRLAVKRRVVAAAVYMSFMTGLLSDFFSPGPARALPSLPVPCAAETRRKERKRVELTS